MGILEEHVMDGHYRYSKVFLSSDGSFDLPTRSSQISDQGKRSIEQFLILNDLYKKLLKRPEIQAHTTYHDRPQTTLQSPDVAKPTKNRGFASFGGTVNLNDGTLTFPKCEITLPRDFGFWVLCLVALIFPYYSTVYPFFYEWGSTQVPLWIILLLIPPFVCFILVVCFVLTSPSVNLKELQQLLSEAMSSCGRTVP